MFVRWLNAAAYYQLLCVALLEVVILVLAVVICNLQALRV